MSFSLAHQAAVANSSFVGVTTIHTLHTRKPNERNVFCGCV